MFICSKCHEENAKQPKTFNFFIQGRSDARCNFGNCPITEFIKRYYCAHELFFTLQHIEDSFEKFDRYFKKFDEFPGNYKAKRKEFGTSDRKDYAKIFEVNRKVHTRSTFMTRFEFKGDLTKIEVISPNMHNLQYAAKQNCSIHFYLIDVNFPLSGIQKIKKTYGTAMNNKKESIATSATRMRQLSRQLEQLKCPQQILESDNLCIKSLFSLSILYTIMDRTLYLYDSIECPKKRLAYRVAAMLLCLQFEASSLLIHGKRKKGKYVSTNATTYMFDLVAWQPFRMDKYKEVPPKLLNEDDFEGTFLNAEANNRITRNRINIGPRTSEIDTQRAIHCRLKVNKSTASKKNSHFTFITPLIRVCNTCCSKDEYKYWQNNISDMMEVIDDSNEFSQLVTKNEQYTIFHVGDSQKMITVCPSGQHSAISFHD